MKTWRDGQPWALSADEYGLDCPICERTIGDQMLSLGELADLVTEHIEAEHVPTIDGEAG